MAGVTAHITSGAVTLTSRRKGGIGNIMGYKQIVSGITGAAAVSVSGLDITVLLKNTDGVTPTSTIGEVYSALSGSTDAQALVAVVQAGDTGATGVAFTGSGGAFVRGISGAEGTSTITYDDLGEATGAGDWKTFSGPSGTVVAERVRGPESNFPGTIERQSAVANTGSAALVLALGRTQDRLARKGAIGPTDY